MKLKLIIFIFLSLFALKGFGFEQKAEKEVNAKINLIKEMFEKGFREQDVNICVDCIISLSNLIYPVDATVIGNIIKKFGQFFDKIENMDFSKKFDQELFKKLNQKIVQLEKLFETHFASKIMDSCIKIYYQIVFLRTLKGLKGDQSALLLAEIIKKYSDNDDGFCSKFLFEASKRQSERMSCDNHNNHKEINQLAAGILQQKQIADAKNKKQDTDAKFKAEEKSGQEQIDRMEAILSKIKPLKENGMTRLQDAVSKEDLANVERILKLYETKKFYDVISVNGLHVLHYAVINCLTVNPSENSKTILYLLLHYAIAHDKKINVKDKEGNTPLDLVLRSGNRDIISLFWSSAPPYQLPGYEDYVKRSSADQLPGAV